MGTVAHLRRGSLLSQRHRERTGRPSPRGPPTPAGERMNRVIRLTSYGRQYWTQIVLAVILMALAGAATGAMPLLIQPVFDRVLVANAPDGPIALLPRPIFGHQIYLDQIIPLHGRTVWTMVAVALLLSFFIKGVCDYFGNYLVSYAGYASVTRLRNAVFDK